MSLKYIRPRAMNDVAVSDFTPAVSQDDLNHSVPFGHVVLKAVINILAMVMQTGSTLKTVVKSVLTKSCYGRWFLNHKAVGLPGISAPIFIITTWTQCTASHANVSEMNLIKILKLTERNKISKSLLPANKSMMYLIKICHRVHLH